MRHARLRLWLRPRGHREVEDGHGDLPQAIGTSPQESACDRSSAGKPGIVTLTTARWTAGHVGKSALPPAVINQKAPVKRPRLAWNREIGIVEWAKSFHVETGEGCRQKIAAPLAIEREAARWHTTVGKTGRAYGSESLTRYRRTKP